ncbi:MAG: hypothetical protein EA362_00390 [Saprospirales bacterium]|nr:MAG: hypothetical protein EA362_00390 [Saprospirales bacterium]
METIEIDILNPKAKTLLKNLADLKLIKINKQKKKTDFSHILQRLRTRTREEISIDDITKEVEAVRKKRYEP